MASISRRGFGFGAGVLASMAAAASPMLVGDQAAAQPAAAAPSPSLVMGAERHRLRAKHIDQSFAIDVLPVISPFRPPQPGQKIPVVFVLDGNLFFPMVAPAAFLLGLEELPSMLVVGVGYDFRPSDPLGASMFQLQALRNRDFTPSVDKAFLEQMNAQYRRFGATYPSSGAPGGAKAFLAFINDELKPFLAARYPLADPGDSAILGDSFGGLFALYALFNAPGSFDRYVAASPAVWWDNAALFKDAAAFAGAPAKVFMSVGSLEPEDRMLGPVRRMDAELRSGRHPGLDCRFHVFEGDTHASVISAALIRGLREVFR